jgi:transposase
LKKRCPKTFGVVQFNVTSTKQIRLEWSCDRAKYKQALTTDRAYLLRSNQAGWTAAEFWETYMQLTLVDRAFRVLKGEVRLRPIRHHYSGRTCTYFFVCVLAYALWKALDHLAKQTGLTTKVRKPDLARL